MKELAERIAELTQFEDKTACDTSRPDGQPLRCLDTNKAKEEFGLKGKNPLPQRAQPDGGVVQSSGRSSG